METQNLNDFTNEQMPTQPLEKWQKELLGIANVEQADHGLLRAIADFVLHNPREVAEVKERVRQEAANDNGDNAAIQGVAGQYRKELNRAGIGEVTDDNVDAVVEILLAYSGENMRDAKVAAEHLRQAKNRRQNTWWR